jgi:hypothetical protein
MMGSMGTSPEADDASAGQEPALRLPEPTGPCPVGTTSLWLTDTSRPDPWATGVGVRELMVSLWYPAASADGRRAQYMTAAESRLLLAGAVHASFTDRALLADQVGADIEAGLARAEGGRGVAAEDLPVGAAGLGGAVRVEDDLPAVPVNTDVMVKLAQENT